MEKTARLASMAITTTRDERRKWLLARAIGSLSLDEVRTFVRDTRANVELRMWPMLFDARSCATSMTDDDVEAAVAIVRDVVSRGEQRGHVALVADDDVLYRWFLLYEARCVEAGVRVIRVFRQEGDAVRWLEIVSMAREFGG